MLTKSQWQGVHVLTAAVFLVCGLFHLLKFNWHLFWAYVTKRSEAGFRYGREMAFSLLLFVVVAGGTILGLPPFSSVIAAGEAAKNSWSSPANEPPLPHMEELTLAQVADRLQMPEEKAVAQLEANGMGAETPKQTLAEIARGHGRTPQQVYAALQGPAPAPAASATHSGASMGLGSKTVADVASEMGISSEAALAQLKKRNIDAQSLDTIRTVASNAGMRPFEIVELLKEATR